jgi:hypothetical protein
MRAKDWFVAQYKVWWKLWSTWWSVAWGMVVSAVWIDPTIPQAIVSNLPEQYRTMLSPIVLGVVSGLPILIRLLKQNIKKPLDNGEKQATLA